MKTPLKIVAGIVAVFVLGAWRMATWMATNSPGALSQRFVTAIRDHKAGSVFENLLVRGADPDYDFDMDQDEKLKNQLKQWETGSSDRNNTDYEPFPVLFFACQNGNKDAVIALINHKANINYTFRDGLTPLKGAIFSRNPEIVRILIENGADVKQDSGNWGTALEHAKSLKQEKIVALLKQAGAVK